MYNEYDSLLIENEEQLDLNKSDKYINKIDAVSIISLLLGLLIYFIQQILELDIEYEIISICLISIAILIQTFNFIYFVCIVGL